MVPVEDGLDFAGALSPIAGSAAVIDRGVLASG